MRQRLLEKFRQTVKGFDTENKLRLLTSLEGRALEAGRNSQALRLLPVLLSTLDKHLNDGYEVKKAVSNVFVRLSMQLWQSAGYERFGLVAQSMALIMRQKHWAMTQWTVDNAISALTVTVSPSGPRLDSEHAISVYRTLCDIMGLLLASYRRRIGGRFHLIIPFLQAMLRCLFTVDASKARHRRTTERPPWLWANGNKIDVQIAAAYARLLTTICEPTVSSVSSSKRRPEMELNDETRRVRAYAGQYLPYLIMEYARCQLDGHLAPEVKAALTPGLYAIFGVMPREAMQMVNAAMDSSSRAIFKALYDEYRRFGKWDKI